MAYQKAEKEGKAIAYRLDSFHRKAVPLPQRWRLREWHIKRLKRKEKLALIKGLKAIQNDN